MSTWKLLVILLLIAAIGGLIPAFFVYGPLEVFKNLFGQYRGLFFIGSLLLIFLIGGWFLFRKRPGEPEISEDEQVVHIIVLLVAIASFYAFGWPKGFNSGAPDSIAQAQDLAQKFAELCVILVLFLLSELAIKLNYDAKKNIQEVRRLTTDTKAQLDTKTREISDYFKKASDSVLARFEPAGEAITEAKDALVRFTTDDYPKLKEKLDNIQNSLVAAWETIAILDRLPDNVERENVWNMLNGLVQSWVDIFCKLGGDETKFKALCLNRFFEKYVHAEIETHKNPVSFPATIFSFDGVKIKKSARVLEDYEMPRVVTTEKLYTDMLECVASSVASELEKEDKKDTKVLFYAFSNLLPLGWFNWKHSLGREYVFDGIEGYKGKLDEVFSDPRKYVYRRYVIVEDDDKIRDRFREGTQPELKSEDREKLSHCGISSYGDLRYDLDKTFLLIKEKEDIKKPTKAKDLIAMINALIKDLKAKGVPGCDTLVVPERIAALDAENREIYPILDFEELEKVGIQALNPNWRVDREVSIGAEKIKILSLGEVFIDRLHINKQDCYVIKLKSERELSVFPDKKTDIVLIGIMKNEEKRWLFAIASGLFPGDDTMNIRIVTKREFLNHIATLPDYFREQSQVAPIL